MQQAPAPRLRPGVRGTFDEETCRMHLHEVGRDIVPRYPFALGIQEIYAILLREYGRSQIADAISVLHELLEDESYEGNIWRSWRHGWRHRNDDILDPFVPAVDGFVLPPPTSKCIRALRAANFSAVEGDGSLPDRTSALTHDESRPSYISCHSPSYSLARDRSLSTSSIVKHDPVQFGHQEDQPNTVTLEQQVDNASEPEIAQKALLSPGEADEDLFSSKAFSRRSDGEECGPEFDQTQAARQASCITQDDEPEKDSQQEFADVTGIVDHADDPNIVQFEMMTADMSHSLDHRRTQSDPTGTVSLLPVYSGEATRELVSDAAMTGHSSPEHFDQDNEEPQENFANTLDTLQKRLQRCQGRTTTSSPMLEMVHLGSVGDVCSAIEEAPAGFDHHTGTSWYQDTVDDEDSEAEELLPDRAYVDETLRMSLSAVKSYTVEKTAPSIDTPSDHASFHSWRPDKSKALSADHRENSIVGEEVLTLAPYEPPSPTPGRFPIDSPSEEEISHIRTHKCKSNDHEKGVTCSPVSFARYPIDGHHEGSLHSAQTSVGARRGETQPKWLIHRGRSLLQRMPKFFQKGRASKQTNQQRGPTPDEHPSISQGLFRRKSNKAGWCSAPRGDSPPDFAPKRTTPAYNFDGACDEYDTATNMSAVDLNKALPPQPRLRENEPAVIGRTEALSPTHFHGTKPRPSTASTGSSDLSRVSSKKRFHRTAHGLVHPEMSESREPSPLREMDSDKFLVGSKYDPLAFEELPDTPITFSSFNNANPFMDRYDEFIPPLSATPIPETYPRDPVKVSIGCGIPQSRSEGQIHSPKTLQVQHDQLHHHLPQSDGTNEHATTDSRGRLPGNNIPGGDISQATDAPANVDQKARVRQTESRKRSRSPVKRFLGLGKSQSLKEIPQEKEMRQEDDKKAGLKLWGDRLRHGFLTNTESKANVNANDSQPEASKAQTPTKSTFPVSVPPLRQARLFCELELMICTAANKFLKAQQKGGLMSADSVSKIIDQWSRKNRPQVVEFQFDQATQRDLILYNINTFRFHGDARTNPMVLNATMYAWKVMAKEMSVRTFCTPDSVIRKHLHDTHKVLEMLGAGLTTFLVLQDMQVEALKEIAVEQKKRVERRNQRERDEASGGGSAKTRKFTPPTPTSFMSAPMSALMDEETLFEDPYEG